MFRVIKHHQNHAFVSIHLTQYISLRTEELLKSFSILFAVVYVLLQEADYCYFDTKYF